MLLLTKRATDVIRRLLDKPTTSGSAGIRIHHGDEGEDHLVVSRVSAPATEDRVIDDGGARIFVGPRADAELDDKILDATIATGGKVRFTMSPQTDGA